MNIKLQNKALIVPGLQYSALVISHGPWLQFLPGGSEPKEDDVALNKGGARSCTGQGIRNSERLSCSCCSHVTR